MLKSFNSGFAKFLCGSAYTIAVGFLIARPAAAATTAATTMTTTAGVTASCAIGGTPALTMAGLTYGATATATGNLTITCTNGTGYNVLFDQGAGTAATTANRVLTGATAGNTATLGYGLYRDAAYTLNWGNTVGTDTLAETGSGAAQTWPVYTKILTGLQTAPVDTYTDTVNVTVSY